MVSSWLKQAMGISNAIYMNTMLPFHSVSVRNGLSRLSNLSLLSTAEALYIVTYDLRTSLSMVLLLIYGFVTLAVPHAKSLRSPPRNFQTLGFSTRSYRGNQPLRLIYSASDPFYMPSLKDTGRSVQVQEPLTLQKKWRSTK